MVILTKKARDSQPNMNLAFVVLEQLSGHPSTTITLSISTTSEATGSIDGLGKRGNTQSN